MRRIRLICHDCGFALSDDDRLHYVYQCHECVVIEHDRLVLAGRDPDHPEAERLAASAIELVHIRPLDRRRKDAAAA